MVKRQMELIRLKFTGIMLENLRSDTNGDKNIGGYCHTCLFRFFFPVNMILLLYYKQHQNNGRRAKVSKFWFQYKIKGY